MTKPISVQDQFSDDQKDDIKNRWSNGETQKQIAEHYDVDPSCIDNWEREGMPVKRHPGIRKGEYDPKLIDEWLKERGNK